MCVGQQWKKTARIFSSFIAPYARVFMANGWPSTAPKMLALCTRLRAKRNLSGCAEAAVCPQPERDGSSCGKPFRGSPHVSSPPECSP